MDPNSQHQRWSRWSFDIISPDLARRPKSSEVVDNARRFFATGFHSTVGRVRVDRRAMDRYAVSVEIEGPPVHDPCYRMDVARRVAEHFVARGFGPQARIEHWTVMCLAGDAEDGKPPAQALFMPQIASDSACFALNPPAQGLGIPSIASTAVVWR
jgi:hypothetical protein